MKNPFENGSDEGSMFLVRPQTQSDGMPTCWKGDDHTEIWSKQTIMIAIIIIVINTVIKSLYRNSSALSRGDWSTRGVRVIVQVTSVPGYWWIRKDVKKRLREAIISFFLNDGFPNSLQWQQHTLQHSLTTNLWSTPCSWLQFSQHRLLRRATSPPIRPLVVASWWWCTPRSWLCHSERQPEDVTFEITATVKAHHI